MELVSEPYTSYFLPYEANGTGGRIPPPLPAFKKKQPARNRVKMRSLEGCETKSMQNFGFFKPFLRGFGQFFGFLVHCVLVYISRQVYSTELLLCITFHNGPKTQKIDQNLLKKGLKKPKFCIDFVSQPSNDLILSIFKCLEILGTLVLESI